MSSIEFSQMFCLSSLLQAQQLTELEKKLAVAKNELEKAALDRVSCIQEPSLLGFQPHSVCLLMPAVVQSNSRHCTKAGHRTPECVMASFLSFFLPQSIE